VNAYCFTGAAVAQSVKWLTTGWTIGVRSPTGAEDFSSSPCVQTGSGAHPASYTMGKARPRRDANHSPPHPVPRLSMGRSYTSSPPMCHNGSGGQLFTVLSATTSSLKIARFNPQSTAERYCADTQATRIRNAWYLSLNTWQRGRRKENSSSLWPSCFNINVQHFFVVCTYVWLYFCTVSGLK
jgi:hypothetical protein